MKNPQSEFSKVGFYCLTVIIGLILHAFGTLAIIYWLMVRKNPFKFVKGMLPAILTALATASRSLVVVAAAVVAITLCINYVS